MELFSISIYTICGRTSVKYWILPAILYIGIYSFFIYVDLKRREEICISSAPFRFNELTLSLASTKQYPRLGL